jgi:transcriptional regulator with XRE-family HTH domain
MAETKGHLWRSGRRFPTSTRSLAGASCGSGNVKDGDRRIWLARWELGFHQPPLAALARLSRLLGVTLDELITGEPPAGTALTRAEQARLADRLEKMQKWLR